MKQGKIQTPVLTETPDVSKNRAQRRAIRFKRVLEIVPLSASRIYELIAAGSFPSSWKATQNGHASFFWEEEVYDWLDRSAASRAEGK